MGQSQPRERLKLFYNLQIARSKTDTGLLGDLLSLKQRSIRLQCEFPLFTCDCLEPLVGGERVHQPTHPADHELCADNPAYQSHRTDGPQATYNQHKKSRGGRGRGDPSGTFTFP